MSRARISYNVQDLLIGNPLDKYEDPDYYGGYISKDNGWVAW